MPGVEGSRPTILIVEDQADVRKLLSLTFRKLQCDLLEAASASDALAVLDNVVPAVVLLDVMLPGDRNGFDLCRQIKSDPRFAASKVVLMTAADQAAAREQAAASGADHYVPKPFSPLSLRELVGSLLV